MCVRSSTTFYSGFNLDMDRSPGFGYTHADLFAQLRLGFPAAPYLWYLTSPACVTRRTVLQKVRGPANNAVPQLVNIGFQVLFHSPPGVLFTFPSQYYALSVTGEYLALGGGPPDFPQGSTCLVVLRILPGAPGLRVRGCHPVPPAFPGMFPCPSATTMAVHYPAVLAPRFGLLRVRSPLLAESIFLSFPPAT